MKNNFFLLILLISSIGIAQKKTLQTKFTNEKITIDGKFDEEVWKTAEICKDFVSYQPDNGNPEPNDKKTEVKIVYDNNAIYIAATMYDDPTKILKEFSLRDDFGSADFFGVLINGFNDGQQDFRFFVSASNGQADCQASENDGEDFSWDAIWESKSRIIENGWVVEMKLPYAALRFSPSQKQIWGLNFMREVRRDRQKYTWNFIDNKKGTFIQQAGILEGIENIKTPTRLFFLPYTSYYLNGDAKNKTKGTLKGGMDIKYGINDAFTLDAVLIPDFGQTALDQKILNLGPFEQQLNENRTFFTEGTDLFSKGGLLYSRRIGGAPSKYAETNTNEKILQEPTTVGLLNALKISGRTKNGLGIGILNAVTENTYARIQDTITGVIRKELIEPLANFNVLVMDKRFRKNSSISFINTNVTRNGEFRDANVSALTWDLKTKANTFGLNGNATYSYLNQNLDHTTGFRGGLEFNKTSGKHRFGVGSELYTKDFDSNDLGINFQSNYYSFYGNFNYRILQPTKTFNSFSVRTNIYSEFNKETNKLQSGNNNNIQTNINASDKGNNYYAMGININPFKGYDYYSPQTDGRFVIQPSQVGGWLFVSTNFNKKFAFDLNPYFNLTSQKSRSGFGISFEPRYRFSDKFSIIYKFNYGQDKNDKGFTKNIGNDIIFARRDNIDFTNSISGKYSINSQMNINLLIRHYWRYSENFEFYSLNPEGDLSNYYKPIAPQNRDFSTWNFDLSYVWWFAPGSQISILLRNNAENKLRNLTDINKDGVSNLKSLLNNQVLSNSFSISLRYFIDYNQAKNWF